MSRRPLRWLALGLCTLIAAPVWAVPSASAADPDPLDWDNYEKIVLTRDVGEPIDLAVLPDERVLHTARGGDLRLTDPVLGTTKVVNHLDVYNAAEDGLQTVSVDPDFAQNRWVYLYYAPRVMSGTAQNGQPYPTSTPSGSAPNTLPAGQTASYWQQWLGYNQLSRFKWDEAAQALDLSTEQVIIKVEVNRGQCCHVAGDVGWDAAGNLYLATGDNTSAHLPGTNGMAPNLAVPDGNPGNDARRGAGSSNDLRGSILRIKVADDGSYTVPAGNLWAPGTPKTRPEIFVKGLRNPFRMNVDPVSGTVNWGDYGPDAGVPIPGRGPAGYVEWQITSVDRPLNGGWPYCTGDQFNYNDYDYTTGTSGRDFDCAAGPVNNSPFNTGLQQLPPATTPTMYYGFRSGDQPAEWDGLVDFGTGTAQSPMAGPIYQYDPANPSETKFPAYWDDKAFFAEFQQDYAAAFTVDLPNGPVTKLENFLPNGSVTSRAVPPWDGTMDIEFGPDGSLYVLDYGTVFSRANPEAGLYRVDWAPGNKAPTAAFRATPTSSSSAPLTVAFDATASVDPERTALAYDWDFTNDGTFDATGAGASHTYTEVGAYTARLRVTDASGKTGVVSRQISVGNQAPTVAFSTPDGGFFDWGQAVPWSVTTDDPEEGTATACTRMAMTFSLGHDTHAHPETTGVGCSGVWVTPVDAPEHGEAENIFAMIIAQYTDAGAAGVPAATGDAQVTLNPKVQQAEWLDASSGVEVAFDPAAAGLNTVTSFDAGDWIAFDPVNFSGIDGGQVKASGDGTLSLRWGSADSAPFATATVSDSGWQTVALSVDGSLPTGTGRLYVTSTGGVVVDQLEFLGSGIADATPPTATATLSPATPTGADGWNTSDVVVTVDGTDNAKIRFREYSLDGGQTWVQIPIRLFGLELPGDFEYPGLPSVPFTLTLTTSGVHTVQYRTTDYSGLHSEVGTLTVKIDKVPPTVSVSGLQDGATYGDSTSVVPTWTVTDGTSGVGTVTASLDGGAVRQGTPIRLATLPLGEHTLVVTAKDGAGNTATATHTFTVTTSYDDVDALIGQFLASRTLKPSTAEGLRDRLVRAESAAAVGQGSRAAHLLDQFAARVKSQVKATAPRELLLRDAAALKGQLGG